jgi:hypothetical protein
MCLIQGGGLGGEVEAAVGMQELTIDPAAAFGE